MNSNVLAIIDNDIGKQKNSKKPPVISLAEYKKNYAGFADVLICSYRYAHEMEKQLLENNIFNFAFAPEIWERRSVVEDVEISHGNWGSFLEANFNIPGYDILEIGSRVVTGANFRNCFSKANYVGFDYYEGSNVDVVGDIHNLSQCFDRKFDLIFSSAVFEHLAMPWKAALEIIKCLKIGGYVFIETHYSFTRHEEPWHFFQFSENALHILFPEKFGMQCIRKGCSNPLVARFAEDAAYYLKGKFVKNMYCHSEIFLKKVREVPSGQLSWDNILLSDVVGSTEYPKP